MKNKNEYIIIGLVAVLFFGAIGIQDKDNILYRESGEHISFEISEEYGKDTILTNDNLNLKIAETNDDLNFEIVKDSNDDENIQNNKKININTATKDELMQLNGIGDSISDKIIDYRQNGKFQSIDEIKNVKGIGESKFEDIKNFIEV